MAGLLERIEKRAQEDFCCHQYRISKDTEYINHSTQFKNWRAPWMRNNKGKVLA